MKAVRGEAHMTAMPTSSLQIAYDEENCNCSLYWPPRCYWISDKIKILFTGGAILFAQVNYGLSAGCAAAAGIAYSLQENTNIDTSQVVTPLWIASIGFSGLGSATLVFRNLFCRTTVEIDAAEAASLNLDPSRPLGPRNVTDITEGHEGQQLEDV